MDSTDASTWERDGRVWIVDPDEPLAQPLLDISAEVGGWRDHGLLGFALHPAFRQNGYVYVLYVVDRHHLMNCNSSQPGAPVCNGSYNASTNEYFAATIGRITRYRAIKHPGDVDYARARSIDPASRLVLLGETPQTGCPVLYESHSVGSLVFGEDGSLFAGCGDGGSYSVTDPGSIDHTYYVQALADGIIKPKENVGAFRSQLIDSLAGKVLRIDPATGDGLANNPFYDPAEPRAAKSRVWALGLRNPYRMTLRAGSGNHDPAANDPGSLYIGDVGWSTWEDLHVSHSGRENFGWPLYEGMTAHTDYVNQSPYNQDAPNPLFGQGACGDQYFRFRDLLKQDTLGTPSYPNPCNTSQQVPVSIDRFLHSRPVIDWRHGAVNARWAAFNNDTAENPQIGQPNTQGTWIVTGSPFQGNASTGGSWYTGDQFPATYKNTYFHGDYGGQWIQNVVFDAATETPTAVRAFGTALGGVVAIREHPLTGDLYYISWATFVRKISYVGTGNRAPVANATADRTFGPAPLAVQFSSAGSSDPDGNPLTFLWNFGDGTATSTAANPGHTFNVAGGGPAAFTVTLTVTDSLGASTPATLLVSPNNTPPTATITSPLDGSSYSMSGVSQVPLTAILGDAETGTGSLTCEWQVFLHHNQHTHEDPIINACSSVATISPIGCDAEEIYFFRIHLRVRDPQGLQIEKTSDIFPDCTSNPPPVANPDSASVSPLAVTVINILANDTDDTGLNPGSVVFTQQPAWGTVVLNANGTVSYTSTAAGHAQDQFKYKVRDISGTISNEALVTISLTAAPQAAFTATPLTGSAPLAVAFDGSTSSDSDGTIASYAWMFGDGATATGVTASHTYETGGNYTARLTVTDNQNATGTTTREIVVAAGEWWSGNWSQRRQLTFDNTGIDENLVNVPLLLRLDATRVDYSYTQPDGSDLRFVDADGVTPLPYEIESWNPGGISTVWVRVPQVDANSNADFIWLYYGNPVAASGANPTAVWSNNHAAVWHFSSDQDATSNANHLTRFGVQPVDGLAAGAMRFDGTSSYYSAGNPDSLNLAGSMTVEAWVKLASLADSTRRLISKKSTWNAPTGYQVEYDGNLNVFTGLSSGSNYANAKNVDLDANWHYLSVTYSGTTGRLYVDGVARSTDTSIGALVTGSTALEIGRTSGSGNYFNGDVDEMRISNVARSAAWIAAQNRSLRDTFIHYSGPLNLGSNSPPTVVLTSPAGGAGYYEGADVLMTADAADTDGVVSRVDFFADGNLIGTDYDAPFSIVWVSVPQGNFSLAAQARDNKGAAVASAAHAIEVSPPPNDPPVVDAGPDFSIEPGVVAHIQGSATDDGLPVGRGLSVSWSTLSGPGTPAWPNEDDSSPHTHVQFPVAGTYVLRLAATDGQFTSTDDVTIDVTGDANSLPQAYFTMSQTAGVAPLSIAFDGSGSSDPDGSIAAYEWTFGDGTTGSGLSLNHVYGDAGTFTATLRVTDNRGGVATTTRQITVYNDWWNLNWPNRRKLTFDNTGIDENLVNVPLLLRLDATRVDYSYTQPDGSDLRFVDADGVTPLPYEIESWNPGGISTVWVRVPQVDANSNADFIWLYYGNPVAASGAESDRGLEQQSRRGVAFQLRPGRDLEREPPDPLRRSARRRAGRGGHALRRHQQLLQCRQPRLAQPRRQHDGRGLGQARQPGRFDPPADLEKVHLECAHRLPGRVRRQPQRLHRLEQRLQLRQCQERRPRRELALPLRDLLRHHGSTLRRRCRPLDGHQYRRTGDRLDRARDRTHQRQRQLLQRRRRRDAHLQRRTQRRLDRRPEPLPPRYLHPLLRGRRHPVEPRAVVELRRHARVGRSAVAGLVRRQCLERRRRHHRAVRVGLRRPHQRQRRVATAHVRRGGHLHRHRDGDGRRWRAHDLVAADDHGHGPATRSRVLRRGLKAAPLVLRLSCGKRGRQPVDLRLTSPGAVHWRPRGRAWVCCTSYGVGWRDRPSPPSARWSARSATS